MKVFLMYKDRDFDPQQAFPANEQDLTQDLELNTLFNAMAAEDEFIYKVVKSAVLSGMKNGPETILYRQDILRDCLENISIIREIYHITIESVENRKRGWFSVLSSYPRGILSGAIEMLEMLTVLLKKLHNISIENSDKFKSAGFSRFFKMIIDELGAEYVAEIEKHLKDLKFRSGILTSAGIGKGNEINNYTLCKSGDKKICWLKKVITKKPQVYTYTLHPRDEAGSRILSQLNDRAVNQIANALAQSSNHVDGFFKTLRIELAFYTGCLNLHDKLVGMEEPVSFPMPVVKNNRSCSFRELYDICLALTMRKKVTGNNINADNKDLVIITGANQGGKSTFLRSIGLAQLMMQCGMFVPAESFRAGICDGLFTHYKREEDVSMKSGKLDEELGRMNSIIDNITSNPILLFNESFAATNEREGSEIARQIVCALIEKHVRVFFVTHLYEFANIIYKKKMKNTCFLRAEREPDGKRTFKIIEGEPLQTSYGIDLFNRVFHDAGTGSEIR